MKIFKSCYLLFVALVCFISSFAQDIRGLHREELDDEFVIVDKTSMQRSTPYQTEGDFYFTRQVNVDGNGQNIIGDAANEPSIAVDPTNPFRMVIGWRQFDTVNSNFRQAGYGYSLDGGLTWTFPGVLDPGNFRSDPVLDFDSEGNFYYNSLQSSFACDVFRITDGGTVWSSPVSAQGGDKQWMEIDRSGGIGEGHNYSYWNENFTTCAPGAFTRSTDGGLSFEDCESITGSPFWGTLAVDGNGDLYITGRSGTEIIVVKSTNAKDGSQTVVWDFSTVVDLNGTLGIFPLVNPEGLLGQAWVDVDVSGGPGDGNVYVLATVVNNDDQGDVMFAKSTDGGTTFEAPQRINTDPEGNFNWFGTMSVAPNGRIDVIWLDTSEDPNNILSKLYYTFSNDQGTTWVTPTAISEAFDSTVGWPQQNKMGDYFDMVSDNEAAHIAWANTLNGGQDVFYTKVIPSLLSVNSFSLESMEMSLFPNPAKEKVTITLASAIEDATIEVFDILGRKVQIIYEGSIEKNQEFVWDISKEQLSGLYFVVLQSANATEITKLITQN